MTDITIQARPPFSFSGVVKSHGWSQLNPFLLNVQTGELSYIDRLTTGRVLALHFEDTINGVSVKADADLSPVEETEVKQKVTWMLGLDMDFSGFYAIASQEPALAKAISSGRGRVLRCPTFFEDVVKTILTTNTLWSGTIRMAKNLVDNYGDVLQADPSQHAFPSPERLALSSVDELRQVARLGYRTPYVHELAQSVACGKLDLESLITSSLPTIELRKVLLSIKGIGAYAAANLLMLLGRYDFVPIDSWALKVVSHEWFDDQPIGPKEVEAAFEGWGEWKGLAYWFWDWSLFQTP